MRILSIVATILLMLSCQQSPKLAIVRTTYLIENYEGVKEVQKLYNQEVLEKKQLLDSLGSTYEQIAQTAGAKDTLRLLAIQNKFLETRDWLSRNNSIYDSELLEGAINQINSYVKSYGEKNDYQLIFGTTLDGNVMYAQDAIDITEDILLQMNEEYKK